MLAIDQQQTNRVRVIWMAVLLALLTAGAYLLIDLDVLTVGDLQPEEEPPIIIYVAAASYVLGGLLILLRRRWLWIAGTVINALVILVFVNFYLDRPAVLFSPGGLVTKAGQLLLEASLIYLIIVDWRRSRREKATITSPS